MSDETSSISFLLSGTTLFLALVAFYVGRSLWIARREWHQCATDTKVIYLLVAPALTLAVDVLSVTDRLFWSRASAKTAPARKPKPALTRLVPKTAGRADG